MEAAGSRCSWVGTARRLPVPRGPAISATEDQDAAPKERPDPSRAVPLSQRAGALAGKGPWPAPAAEAAEPLVTKYAADWPAWDHRKIYGL